MCYDNDINYKIFLESDCKAWYNPNMNKTTTMCNTLSEKQKKLVSRNMGLLNSYYNGEIQKGIIPRDHENEFFSILQERLCISAMKFDEETGFKFSTFAYGGFVFGKETFFQRLQRARGEALLNPIEELWEPIVFHRGAFIRHEKIAEFVDNVPLTEKERFALNSYYYDRLSFNRVGKRMGISKETARTIVNRAVGKIKDVAMREHQEKEDFIIKD